MGVKSGILNCQCGLLEHGGNPIQRNEHSAFHEELRDGGFIICINRGNEIRLIRFEQADIRQRLSEVFIK